ncbi:DUF6124 family protein [Pseudomonas sp. nanlin1]|uniref:DUF6124 family protein n=1 Tax=Pseudomonas sp. nanlin1 TaxID=3040605 RepID=UPI00388E1725
MDKLIPDPPKSNRPLFDLTAAHPFGVLDANQRPIFNVPAGINAEDALVHASLLLKCSYDVAYELTENGHGQSGLVWSVLQMVEGARALVDAVLQGGTSSMGRPAKV